MTIPDPDILEKVAFTPPVRLEEVQIGVAASFYLEIDTGTAVVSESIDVEAGVWGWAELAWHIYALFFEIGVGDAFSVEVVDGKIQISCKESLFVDSIIIEASIIDEDIWGWNGYTLEIPQEAGENVKFPDAVVDAFIFDDARKIIDYRIWPRKIIDSPPLTIKSKGFNGADQLNFESILLTYDDAKTLEESLAKGMGFSGQPNFGRDLIIPDPPDFPLGPYSILTLSGEDGYWIFWVNVDPVDDLSNIFTPNLEAGGGYMDVDFSLTTVFFSQG